ncbi:helix-turn-helix transcriptional regulator [Gemmobacter sp.]|uniref:helix-turn-helix domain-containing protein n=1 Tax=Gemmobacter sp. TaxID=1898957 RepID=UPI002AFE3098|nr:helix-turn-helix transcriptional regulator [Gemmobacter sp.]
MNAHQLADMLRTRRLQRGISQRDLAALLNMPQSHLSKIEAGKVDLRISTLAALAAALDLRIAVTVPSEDPAASRTDEAVATNPTAARHVTSILVHLSALLRLRPDDAVLLGMKAALETLASAEIDADRIAPIDAWLAAYKQHGDPQRLQAARMMLDRLVKAGRSPAR